jgi:REP element-mobilizing transposase RayT
MDIECDRYWLLTTTTYGNWLPGDPRGFVSNVRVGAGPEVRHNVPGTRFDADIPLLQHHARSRLRCPPLRLVSEQAEALCQQFQETATHRGWQLLAIAVMANHVHLVIGVPGDPDPDSLLRDFKAYGSRALNKRWSKPESETWWTESGSKRKLPNETAVLAAIRYVIEQEHPLLVWTAAVPELDLAGGRLV